MALIHSVKDVEHLIISSTLDFSTDYVCLEMERRGLSYLRLNRDRFSFYKVKYMVDRQTLFIHINNDDYSVSPESLKSIYFRSPVFIRSNKPYPLEQQLYRSQWSSFIRNLMVFSSARWLNHPVSTYLAENKVYQLDRAKAIGLEIPNTVITNFADAGFLSDDELYVVKALDTPLFYEDGKEMFTYSTISTGKEIKKSSLQDAPVIIQECIQDKTDLRVTVIGEKLFPAAITKSDRGIDGDWRRTKKEDLQYKPIELPEDIIYKLQQLMKDLNLSFGGVDLAFSKGKYYFIEVNPTGEWGWLVKTTGYEIDKEIVNWLTGQ